MVNSRLSAIAALVSLLGTCPSTILAAAQPPARSLPCAISSFQGVVNLPKVTVVIEKADIVPDNGTYGDPTDLGFPQPIDKLPALCAVTISVTNTSDIPSKPKSAFKLGLFLPVRYNGRFLAVGSASFAGGINWQGMSEGPHYGFASMSTDNGHNSIGSDVTWANPQTLYDWGYRAMHGSVVVGKLLVKHYYLNQDIPYSYYAGCSTGGRQGLKEIQYDANSFDGALIGAPSWDQKHLMPWVSKVAYTWLSGPPADILTTQQFNIIAAEVLAQCDPQDGHTDNIVSEPETCVFNLSRIICADPTRCITPGQAVNARRVWDDYRINGRLISHGFGLSSEDSWAVYFGNAFTLQGFDFDSERYFIYNDTTWQWPQFTDKVTLDEERVNPGMATADKFDISGYKTRKGKKGGKILMYHGLADGLISPKTSTQYYQSTAAAMGTDVNGLRSWFRYFQVPGMQHCFFSNRYNAPWDFGAFAQAAELRLLPYTAALPAFGDGWSVPGHLGDPAYDAYAALVKWVEGDKAPDQIIATAFNFDGSVARTRPLCPYPQKAVYRRGDINSAASWSCG